MPYVDKWSFVGDNYFYKIKSEKCKLFQKNGLSAMKSASIQCKEKIRKDASMNEFVKDFLNGSLFVFILEKIDGILSIISKSHRNESQSRKSRQEYLRNNGNIICAAFVPAILQHYVNVRFRYYYSKETGDRTSRFFKKIRGMKTFGVRDLKRQLEKGSNGRDKNIIRNIVITGNPGSGKSTALRWLYCNVDSRQFDHIRYINSRTFMNDSSLDDVFLSIRKKASKKGRTLIFIDGFDEIKLISGTISEFRSLLDCFCCDQKERQCNFVISARAEHFQFESAIRKNQAYMNNNNYTVYEILPLNSAEAISICKSMKALRKQETAYGTNHFQYACCEAKPGKSGNEGLNERQYNKLIKEYFKTNKNIIINTPLLCRYAYTIIKDWNGERTKYAEAIASYKRIETVLNALIKWEFYDTYDIRGEEAAEVSERQRKKEEYRNKVNRFLALAAQKFVLNEELSRYEWEKAKRKFGLNSNAALCLLITRNGNLEFIEHCFEDYYVARAYLQTMKSGDVVNRIVFRKYLIGNRNVAQFFVEMLLASDTAIRDNFLSSFKTLQQLEKPELVDLMVKFVQGYTGLYILQTTKYSIEEWVLYFPHSEILYNGMRFNYYNIRAISQGYLIVESMQVIKGLQLSVITKNTIDKIKIKKSNTTGVMRCFFSYFYRGKYYFMGQTINYQYYVGMEAERIYEKKRRQSTYNGNAVLNNIQLKMSFLEGMASAERLASEEYKTVVSAFRRCIDLMGNNRNYWCLFSNQSIYVYQANRENDHMLQQLIADMPASFSVDMLYHYSLYRGYDMDFRKMKNELTYIKHSDIPLTFSMIDFEGSKYIREFLGTYHSVWIMNYRKLGDSLATEESTKMDQYVRTLRLCELEEKYHLVIRYSPKAALLVNDERIKAAYLDNDLYDMQAHAKDGLTLCDAVGCERGKKARELILSCETQECAYCRKAVSMLLEYVAI